MPVYSPIMLALCFMLLVTYYASNYAGIIGLGLVQTGMISQIQSQILYLSELATDVTKGKIMSI